MRFGSFWGGFKGVLQIYVGHLPLAQLIRWTTEHKQWRKTISVKEKKQFHLMTDPFVKAVSNGE